MRQHPIKSARHIMIEADKLYEANLKSKTNITTRSGIAQRGRFSLHKARNGKMLVCVRSVEEGTRSRVVRHNVGQNAIVRVHPQNIDLIVRIPASMWTPEHNREITGIAEDAFETMLDFAANHFDQLKQESNSLCEH